MENPNLASSSSALPAAPPPIEPEQFEAPWKTCRTDDPSVFDRYLTSLLPSAPTDVSLRAWLGVAITFGPHYATMQYLITRHKVEVTGYMLAQAVKMDLPPSERMKLLDFLLQATHWDTDTRASECRKLFRHCVKDKDMTEYILNQGVDLNVGPISPAMYYYGSNQLVPDSGTMLASAIKCGTIEVVDLLIQHGAVLSYADPAHCAVESGNPAMLSKILELGASVEPPDSTRHFARETYFGSPLIRAVTQGKAEMVEILLEHRANIYRKDARGRSALGLVEGSGMNAEIRAIVAQAQAQC
ncbi:ankyrin [Lentithecium fluviatile CBS 122367]|uniref:Ankyrin n=1 Tax=Lentithecium fluviatile CBS 122367 TaxID=1168545 RepID=A0A6G1IUG9_9PLEO|nr:ankyrin [Lentithecium fluviatile CBS 122367]